MSKWEFVRSCTDQSFTLFNTNISTQETYVCGILNSQVPDAWVLDWIVKQDNALRPGDVILLSSGKVLHFSNIKGIS